MTKFEHVIYDAKAYRRHVHQLAAAFHVLLRENPHAPPDRAYAAALLASRGQPVALSQKAVVCRPVRDETSYAVAMHELGHAVAPDGFLEYEHDRTKQKLRDVRLEMHCEHAAWGWARAFALQWTPLMVAVERVALRSYRAKLLVYERRQR